MVGGEGAALEAIFRAAVAACDPRAVVRAALAEPALASRLQPRPTTIIAIGKAAAAMAAGAIDALGPRRGLVVVPDGVAVDEAALRGLDVRRGGHPIPDARSEAAGREALRIAGAVGREAALLVLVSGGASALGAVPRDGLTLAEKVARTTAAARAGAPIAELNRLRTELSAIKGGRLAGACDGMVVTVVASDVPGDDVAVVGSGPTVPPGGPTGDDVVRLVAGLGRLRAEAAAAARARGLAPVVRAADLVGDIAEVEAVVEREAERGLWIAGGEWTVRLGGEPVGVGGRATELALRLARAWAGRTDRVALVAGSDGVDGTGPAAGAVVDGTTWHAIAAGGVDPARALAGHDSGAALAAVGATVETGPTGVNHADLVLVAAR